MTSGRWASSDWDALVARQLPVIRSGHGDARASYERVVAVVVAERLKGLPDATRKELELLAMIASVDYELKTLLLRLLEAPSERVVWHKYLALVLWQVLEELPTQLGPGLQAEGKAFKSAVKEVRNDRAFTAELLRVRNEVAAHLGTAQTGPGRLEWSFDSMISEAKGEPAILSRLAIEAIKVSAAVHELGSSLIRKHAATFPGARV